MATSKATVKPTAKVQTKVEEKKTEEVSQEAKDASKNLGKAEAFVSPIYGKNVKNSTYFPSVSLDQKFKLFSLRPQALESAQLG